MGIFSPKYNLGTDEIGDDRNTASNNLLASQFSHSPQCYACTAPSAQYRIIAKKPKNNTAQLQNGLYICTHCVQSNTLDSTLYALRDLE